MLQIPIDAHGTTSVVRNVMERPEEDKWVASFRPDEKQESSAIWAPGISRTCVSGMTRKARSAIRKMNWASLGAGR